MDSPRRKWLLVLAVIGLVAAVGYRVMHPYKQPRVARLTYGPDTAPASGVLFPVPGMKAREKDFPIDRKRKEAAADEAFHDETYERFLDQPVVSGDVRKDLFALSGQKTAEERSEKIPPEQTATQQKKRSAPPVRDPVAEVIRHLTRYTLMGDFETGGERAVFLSKGNQVLVARVGDRINGRYRVDAIEENTITIYAMDINETIHLDTREFNHE